MATHGLVVPFEQLVEEARAESLRRRKAQGIASAPPQPHVHGSDLTLTLLQESRALRTRRQLTLPVALLLHVTVVAALIVVPLLLGDTLPAPSDSIRRGFFVEPAVVPPPPPPPPPASGAAVPKRAQASAPAPSEQAFVAPVEVPRTVEEAAPSLDLGIEGGVPGGVEGGVPGGVLGGVVGGISDPAPVAVQEAPLRVGGLLKEPRKVKHVDPIYPQIAAAAGVQGLIIIEAVIDATGHVVDARVLRGVPLLDAAALEAVRQWVYAPTLLNGVPRAVVLNLTVNFRLHRPVDQ